MASVPGSGADEPQGSRPGEHSDEEIDRRFAELTAELELDVGTTLPAPAAESGEPDDAARAAVERPTDEPAADERPTLGGPRDYTPPTDELDERFEPPEPESLSTVDPLLLAAWIGAAGGPVVAILLLVLWSAAPPLVWWCVLAATLLGWGVVLWRLPRSRDPDDDGAQV